MSLEKVTKGSTLGIVLSAIFSVFFTIGAVQTEPIEVNGEVVDNSIWYVLGAAFSTIGAIMLGFYKVIKRYLEIDGERDNRLLDIIEKERQNNQKGENKDHS